MQDLKAIRFVEGTKISHDYRDDHIEMFSYKQLWEIGVPAIGIPCKQNGLIVIDVDVADGINHKKDGREYWHNFCVQNNMPRTYTVLSRSGGYHFYFKIPAHINPDHFMPPKELSDGCDVKWNGWVGAPPSQGYRTFWGTLHDIVEAPQVLIDEMARLIQGGSTKTFDVTDPNLSLELATPLTPDQIKELRLKLEWLQQNGTLSRSEWRDGLFALKAGIDDPALLDEFVCMWTMNRSYVTGDEHQARSIVDKANKYGAIKPGSIFAILNNVRMREGAPTVESPFTMQEILDRSKVPNTIDSHGKLRIEPTESNAAALLGAIFSEEKLYHDTRSDLFIYKGKSHSDAELVNMFLPIIQSQAFGLGLDKFRKPAIANGLEVLMAARKKDPHLEYLNSLTWDGVPRIETFFVQYVGAVDCKYTRLVGTNFWTALAARGLDPGCKFDSMVILEGHEGISKSTLVEAIAGEYTFAPDDKDSFNNIDILRQMHQSMIVELPELVGLIGETSTKVKAFLAKPFDNIRALFAKKAMKHPRGFVFVGTTNQKKYLTLDMGSRRFWPIEIPKHVTSINVPAIRAHKDQLFAEGISRYRDSHPYWYMPADLLDPIIQSKIYDEPLMQPIQEMIQSLGPSWFTMDVYKRLEAQGLITRGLTSQITNRIETALKRLGFNSDASKKWVNPNYQIQAFHDVIQQKVFIGSFI